MLRPRRRTLAQCSDLDDDDLVRQFVGRGWTPALSERLVAFIPIAFGRVYLADAPPRFATDYLIEDPSSGDRQRRAFSGEPIYALAMELAQRWSSSGTSRDVESIALRSGEVECVRTLVADGSSPTDIGMTEPILLRLMPEESARPWWKFW
jgi:hypothetical protein